MDAPLLIGRMAHRTPRMSSEYYNAYLRLCSVAALMSFYQSAVFAIMASRPPVRN